MIGRTQIQQHPNRISCTPALRYLIALEVDIHICSIRCQEGMSIVFTVEWSKNGRRRHVTMVRKIWIPKESRSLILRIAVEAHCRERRYKTYAVTIKAISNVFWWAGMEHDIREFNQASIHCLASGNGRRVARPLSTALHG